ncbi:MAG: nitronate monooxygenase [Pseudomonadota bacterium]
MENKSIIWKKGQELLGSKYAILGGAMSWVSEHNLVAAISNAGGFGVLACGAMNADLLEKEIKATQRLTSNPFGVNLITMHPELDELIEICKKNNVTHVVLAGGLPKSYMIDALKQANIKVIAFAPALVIAKKLIKMRVDGIVIEGMEAGGHIGPVSTTVLAQEILPILKDEIPIFVAGGIGRGEMIAQFLKMGAAGCQLGTRFVCANESIAHENFKNIFLKSQARDTITSIQLDSNFPVIPVRALANKGTDEFLKAQRNAIDEYNDGKLSKEEAQLKIEKFWAGALRRAVIDGDIEYGSVMAGQSVGMVSKTQSTKEIIEELVDQTYNSYFY